MATQAQIDANRRNASRSTGPRTRAGKRRSSFNRLRLGLLAFETLLSDEDARSFLRYRDSLMQRLKPVGEVEHLCADRVVAQAWRLRRILRIERNMFEADLATAQWGQATHGGARDLDERDDDDLDDSAESDDPGDADMPRKPRPDEPLSPIVEGAVFAETFRGAGNPYRNLCLCEQRIERSMYQALHELTRLRDLRKAGKAPGPRERCDLDLANVRENNLFVDEDNEYFDRWARRQEAARQRRKTRIEPNPKTPDKMPPEKDLDDPKPEIRIGFDPAPEEGRGDAGTRGRGEALPAEPGDDRTNETGTEDPKMEEPPTEAPQTELAGNQEPNTGPCAPMDLKIEAPPSAGPHTEPTPQSPRKAFRGQPAPASNPAPQRPPASTPQTNPATQKPQPATSKPRRPLRDEFLEDIETLQRQYEVFGYPKDNPMHPRR